MLFLRNSVAFVRQILSLQLTETELALLCASVLLDPSMLVLCYSFLYRTKILILI